MRKTPWMLSSLSMLSRGHRSVWALRANGNAKTASPAAILHQFAGATGAAARSRASFARGQDHWAEGHARGAMAETVRSFAHAAFGLGSGALLPVDAVLGTSRGFRFNNPTPIHVSAGQQVLPALRYAFDVGLTGAIGAGIAHLSGIAGALVGATLGVMGGSVAASMSSRPQAEREKVLSRSIVSGALCGGVAGLGLMLLPSLLARFGVELVRIGSGLAKLAVGASLGAVGAILGVLVALPLGAVVAAKGLLSRKAPVATAAVAMQEKPSSFDRLFAGPPSPRAGIEPVGMREAVAKAIAQSEEVAQWRDNARRHSVHIVTPTTAMPQAAQAVLLRAAELHDGLSPASVPSPMWPSARPGSPFEPGYFSDSAVPSSWSSSTVPFAEAFDAQRMWGRA